MIFIHPYAGTLAVRLLIAAAFAVSVSSIPAGMIFHGRIASMNFPIDDQNLLAPRAHKHIQVHTHFGPSWRGKGEG